MLKNRKQLPNQWLLDALIYIVMAGVLIYVLTYKP